MTDEPRKPTILAVDDAPENLDVVKNTLMLEHTVKAAISGKIALKMVESQPPDLILLDIMMPEMDGYEVCRRLKSNPITKDIPVIFLTAKDQTVDEARGFGLGAADYIHKPVNPLILQARVKTHLALKQGMENLQNAYAIISRQKDRMEDELKIGREIQRSLLPLIFPAFPEYDEFKIWGSLLPARELGGDFYDFYFVDKDRFCFCIGDVSGKGVPSALFMAVAKTFVKLTAGDEFSPARILSFVNQELSRGNTSAMFVTLFLGILDIKTGKLVYSNGGHNPPYLLQASGDLLRLDQRHGPAVGVLPGSTYKETVTMLSPGDMLFMYTDGITEAMDRQENFFTEARLVDLLRSQEKVPSNKIVEAVLDEVDRFAQGAEQADDITVLGVEFCGPKNGMDHVLAVLMRNQASEMNDVQERFSAFASHHALPEPDAQRIGVILDELLSNVISYGYTDDLDHTIEIKIELLAEELIITIEDDGIPFNPFSSEPPDTSLPLEDRPIGGVGIHLVRNVMDRFSYHRRANRNIITLRKRTGTT